MTVVRVRSHAPDITPHGSCTGRPVLHYYFFLWLIMIVTVIITTVIFRCFAHILWTLRPVIDEGTWFERNSCGSKYYTKGSRSSSSITQERCKQMMVARAFRAVLIMCIIKIFFVEICTLHFLEKKETHEAFRPV